MIRKLSAGVSVLAVAVIAVLLISVGTAAKSAKPAEATVATIGATTQQVGVNTYALIQVDAQDDLWDFPTSLDDVDITASAGEFVEIDPTLQPPLSGCSDQGFSPSSFRCRVNSNGFGQSNTFAPNPGSGANTTALFNDVLTAIGFFSGTTHIQVCNFHPQGGVVGPPPIPDPALCDNNTSHIEAWWQAPPGFLGGNVTFCAKQSNTVCSLLTVVGPVSSLELFAFRDPSTEASQCKGTPVYVIASADYTFNNVTLPFTFDNNRAILCVEARDSNNTLVNNQVITWTTTKGSLGSNVTNTGGPPSDVDNANNMLTSGGTAQSGDIAKVTATIGSATDSVEVQFGGDPATCSIPDIDSLDIGDTAHVVATFLDADGNWVPDGIVGHLNEVDSGDGADNVEFVSVTEDTVKGVIEGDVIGAISGLTTVAASVEQIAGADPTCSEAFELTGDIHLTPVECVDEPDMILFGNPPPAGGGFGTFVFCGGTYEQLLDASNCPEATSVFFYNKPSGTFAVWIPGSDVAAVNDEIYSIFPPEHTPIPEGTIFTAKCK